MFELMQMNRESRRYKIRNCKFRIKQSETVRFERTQRYWVCLGGKETCRHHGNQNSGACTQWEHKAEAGKS